MIQLCLIYLSPAEAEQVKLIRSTLRADVPECSPEEQAMVLEKALNFIATAKEVDVEDAFQSVCRMLIKHVGAALTRRYAFAVRALICERVRGHALRGPSKVCLLYTSPSPRD